MENRKEILEKLYPEDVLKISEGLTDGEVKFLSQMVELLETKYRKDLNKHWSNATVPEGFFEDMGKLGYYTNPLLFEGREDSKQTSQLFQFFFAYTLARFDVSLNTLLGVHSGLGFNTFLFGGSDEQKAKYIPKLASHELRTCFALTEPDHGSDVAWGLETEARREGDKWILNGEKRWIGGANVADVIPIFARDVETNKPKAFIVEREQAGVDIDVIDNKIALRIVPNCNIHLKDVEVKEENRLQNINSFRDIAKVLYSTRAGVAFMATGAMAGALQATLKYVNEREQFGKTIANYQLVQEKLSMMQANLTNAMALSAQIAKLQENGDYNEIVTSIGKMSNALRLRETVAMGRGVCGGNGIVVDYDIARFFSDAEAIFTYEGTHEINALVIGRALTGKAAFN
ncbi:glutaryl-CoA dehydrogenase [Atopostipes suicloacalis DSM 15692]|uniref:Glutaryl-CoA dehydrogenase n=1 Tax=Atopostipes suicloacalis DSM 15692 TaxID=1121025 RepID=A0A1M4SG36_9LACT|nr:acyl-CoA dehydrogenase family protein [Atopostipes suicloacalis]SHE31159.1 glutaryl-CoA dehydrogenase [Atopostipes suicloacalis DSM 15692]